MEYVFFTCRHARNGRLTWISRSNPWQSYRCGATGETRTLHTKSPSNGFSQCNINDAGDNRRKSIRINFTGLIDGMYRQYPAKRVRIARMKSPR
ncbi:hypothetical protein [Burkholderia territorii]|uniref:hypothetical protein n=1 Tax=Burkholderia territorii TaxID=1503055 RepID=UPI000B1749F8|nr:hypothetical protein [Burkholderia territorii]